LNILGHNAEGKKSPLSSLSISLSFFLSFPLSSHSERRRGRKEKILKNNNNTKNEPAIMTEGKIISYGTNARERKKEEKKLAA